MISHTVPSKPSPPLTERQVHGLLSSRELKNQNQINLKTHTGLTGAITEPE